MTKKAITSEAKGRSVRATSSDIAGFVRVIEWIKAHNNITDLTSNALDDALLNVRSEVLKEQPRKAVTLETWLTLAIGGTESETSEPVKFSRSPGTSEYTARLQKEEIELEAELYKIARSHTNWDIERPESSIRLVELIEQMNEDDRPAHLELYQWFCFMATDEFEAAFEQYKSSVLNPRNGGGA